MTASRASTRSWSSSTDHVVLEDLGSTNGTYCNGLKVDTKELADGDKILVGSTTILKFTYHDNLDEIFQKQMYESALRDGLTKAFNKRYFTDRLESEFTFSTRHMTPLTLVLFDIDHFKNVNDTFGHPAGDYVLTELSNMMAASLRAEDIFARYGGEEFAIVCRGSDSHPGADRRRATAQGGRDQPLHVGREAGPGHHQPGSGHPPRPGDRRLQRAHPRRRRSAVQVEEDRPQPGHAAPAEGVAGLNDRRRRTAPGEESDCPGCVAFSCASCLQREVRVVL